MQLYDSPYPLVPITPERAKEIMPDTRRLNEGIIPYRVEGLTTSQSIAVFSYERGNVTEKARFCLLSVLPYTLSNDDQSILILDDEREFVIGDGEIFLECWMEITPEGYEFSSITQYDPKAELCRKDIEWVEYTFDHNLQPVGHNFVVIHRGHLVINEHFYERVKRDYFDA